MEPSRIYKASILIVDDDELNVLVVRSILEKTGFTNLRHTTDSREALSNVTAFKPDLLILDLYMPPPDGFAILDTLGLRSEDEAPPVLIVSADVTPLAQIRALAKGAREFVRKPVEPLDLVMRVRNLIMWRFLNLDLATAKRRSRPALDSVEPDQSNGPVWESEMFSVLRRIFSQLCPTKITQAQMTADVAYAIGQQMCLPGDLLRQLKQAAWLFDFGMVTIPEAIRTSDRRLDTEEIKIMQSHTLAAGEIFAGSRIPALQLLQIIAKSHHEHWDGKGYPCGLRGLDIPLAARIIAVAQRYCALITEKPYSQSVNPAVAREEVSRQSGFAFDPDVVDALVRSMTSFHSADEASTAETGELSRVAS